MGTWQCVPVCHSGARAGREQGHIPDCPPHLGPALASSSLHTCPWCRAGGVRNPHSRLVRTNSQKKKKTQETKWGELERKKKRGSEDAVRGAGEVGAGGPCPGSGGVRVQCLLPLLLGGHGSAPWAAAVGAAGTMGWALPLPAQAAALLLFLLVPALPIRWGVGRGAEQGLGLAGTSQTILAEPMHRKGAVGPRDAPSRLGLGSPHSPFLASSSSSSQSFPLSSSLPRDSLE